MIGRNHGRIEYRETGGYVAAGVVVGVTEFGPELHALFPAPGSPPPGLHPLLIGYGRKLGAIIETAYLAVTGKLLQQPFVSLATRVGQSPSQGRHVETAGIAETAGGGQEPVHLGQHEARAVQIAGGEQELAIAGERAAVYAVEAEIVLGTVVCAPAVLGLKLEAFKPPAGDEIGHARHRLGAVNRGGPVLQDFHAPDGEQGHQAGQVDKTRTVVGLHGGKHLPPAVQQHQRRGDAQSAQIDVGRAARPVLGEVVGIVLRTRIDRQHPNQVADVP